MVKDWVKKLSEIERQTKESYGTDKSPADSFNLALWYYFNLTPEQFKKAGGVELLNLEKELGNQIIRETIFKNHDVSEAKLITGTPEQKAQFKQDKKRSIENEKIFNDSVSAKLSQKEFFKRKVKNLDSCF
ncbi:MAG: hypothetical protein HY764_01875, partial [Candidatus Portnoybacteria bacterium]|nr:hypothetical protein [Candidatus Portnoybacteria bacterium]